MSPAETRAEVLAKLAEIHKLADTGSLWLSPLNGPQTRVRTLARQCQDALATELPQPASAGPEVEALKAGDVISLVGRDVCIVPARDGVSACRDHHRTHRVAVRNIRTNRLSYVHESRLLGAKRARALPVSAPTPCAGCAEKDAARAAADEVATTYRKAWKDAEARATAAEQERDKVTKVAERFEMDLGIARAKLAAAERREAEKDKALREMVHDAYLNGLALPETVGPRSDRMAEAYCRDVLGAGLDVACEHGTAMDVHCCNCHGGFLFDSNACTCALASPSSPSPDAERVAAVPAAPSTTPSAVSKAE